MYKALGLALLFLVGCATSTISVDGDGDGKYEVIVEQGFKGRGCIAVDSGGPTTSVIVQQDGTSDWSVARLFGWIADLAASVFGGGDRSGEMQGPDPMAGCSGLFEAG